MLYRTVYQYCTDRVDTHRLGAFSPKSKLSRGARSLAALPEHTHAHLSYFFFSWSRMAPACQERPLLPTSAVLDQRDDAMQPKSPAHILRERGQTSAAARARLMPILFLHVPKSGGTSLCELARSASLRVPTNGNGTCMMSGDRRVESEGVWAPVYGKNCNPYFSERHDAWGGNGPERMLSYAADRRLNLFAMEMDARPSLLPWGSLAVLVIVRHPLHRLLSICPGAKRVLESSNSNSSSGGGSVISSGLTGGWPGRLWRSIASASTRPHGGTPHVSAAEAEISGCMCRYRGSLVYALGGVPGGGVDRRGVRASHMTLRGDVSRAARFLERANVVLVTERLSDSGPLLGAAFGWGGSGVPKLSPFAAALARSVPHGAGHAASGGPGGMMAVGLGRMRRLSSEVPRHRALLGSEAGGKGELQERAFDASEPLLIKLGQFSPRLHSRFMREAAPEMALHAYAQRIFELRLAQAQRGVLDATTDEALRDEAALWATAPDQTRNGLPETIPVPSPAGSTCRAPDANLTDGVWSMARTPPKRNR